MATGTAQYIPAPSLKGSQTKWVGKLTKSNEKGRTVKDGEYITLKKGSKEPLELTDEQASQLKGLVIPYRVKSAPKVVASEADANSTVNPLDGNVKEVIAHVKTVNDVDILLDLAADEEKGQNRKMVLEAIDSRVEAIELEGKEGEDGED